jgi:hypothetical protein
VTAEAGLLIAMTLAGAAFLVVHVITTWQALVTDGLAWKWRLLALLPPAAPVVAWKAGRRVSPLLWVGVLSCYAVLRVLGW